MNAQAVQLGETLGIEAAAMPLLMQARTLRAAMGTVLFRPGDACPAYLLVMRGVIGVKGVNARGREILYYRVQSGQTCFQTTLCLLTDGRYTAEGVVEEAVEALTLPADVFDALLAASKAFRRYALASFAERLQGLVSQVTDLAFQPLGARLAAALLARSGDEVEITHDALARELGAAREAVSRLLGEWEKQGLVRLKRGRIALKSRDGLSEKRRG
jgi:CRP/FNR family transcriptional regulator